jgi:hypothetical protein
MPTPDIMLRRIVDAPGAENMPGSRESNLLFLEFVKEMATWNN